jgi:hypothetical protein
VNPLSSPSWSRFFEEFHCRECGGQEAYRSRPRGFFERFVLPFVLLQPVRCERCFYRSYILRTIPALERQPNERKSPQSQPPDESKGSSQESSQNELKNSSTPGTRVA